MFGPSAHPFFIKKFVPTSSKPLLASFRDVLATGNISYYMHGEDGFSTRVYIHNYFRLMCDADIPARWHIQCYSRTGKLAAELKGDLTDKETDVVELGSVNGLDAFGVLRVRIIPASPKVFMPQPHGTMFYNEYYRAGTSTSIMAHSLHVPMAVHGKEYQRFASGLVVPNGFTPYLFLASGCSFNAWRHPACTKVRLVYVNQNAEELIVPLTPMKPMECRKLDLFAMDNRIRAHIGSEPFGIKVIGENFLAKPFIFLLNGSTALGEHL